MKSQVKGQSKLFQVVKFHINDIGYALDLQAVREIIYYRKATPMPEAPSFIEGVVDIRGRVIPVMDLKKKIGMEDESKTLPNHILILQPGQTLIGLIVDEVLEILQVREEQVQSPQKIHRGPGSRYLAGVFKIDDDLVFLLNLDTLFTRQEKESIDEIET